VLEGTWGLTAQGAPLVKIDLCVRRNVARYLKKSVFRLITFLNKYTTLSQKCYHRQEEQPGADSPPADPVYVNLKCQGISFFHFK